MKATRAYIASLGTTGLLLASSVLLLVVVSALLAFRGWPGGGAIGGLKGLVVGHDEPSLQLSGPAQAALNVAPAAGAVAGGAPAPPGTAGRAARGGGAGATPPPAGRGGGTPTGTPPPGGTSGGGGSAPGAPGGPAPAQPPVSPGQVGDTTEETTKQLAVPLGGVSPQLGQGVTDTGKALSDLVKGVGLPPPP